MTRKRNDEHSTEFGLWLRNQESIDSKLGFVTTNIDYAWKNYKLNKWRLIEEKRHMAKATFPQKDIFKTVHRACKSDPNYGGIHLIQFENTSPEDGDIYLDGELISKDFLLRFLRFED